jgi:hypothetical protein
MNEDFMKFNTKINRSSDEFKHYIWKKITFSMDTKNTSYVINPMSVHKRTKGRIEIDFMNNLIIRKVLKIDGGYYGSRNSISLPHIY